MFKNRYFNVLFYGIIFFISLWAGCYFMEQALGTWYNGPVFVTVVIPLFGSAFGVIYEVGKLRVCKCSRG